MDFKVGEIVSVESPQGLNYPSMVRIVEIDDSIDVVYFNDPMGELGAKVGIGKSYIRHIVSNDVKKSILDDVETEVKLLHKVDSKFTSPLFMDNCNISLGVMSEAIDVMLGIGIDINRHNFSFTEYGEIVFTYFKEDKKITLTTNPCIPGETYMVYWALYKKFATNINEIKGSLFELFIRDMVK